MTIPRTRLTVRRLIIAVALAGLALGGCIELGRLRRLSADFTERAERARIISARKYSRGLNLTHAQWLDQWRRISEFNRQGYTTGAGVMRTGGPPPPDVCRVMTNHYAQLEAKYRRAARYPWLAVVPDPPLPEMPWTIPE